MTLAKSIEILKERGFLVERMTAFCIVSRSDSNSTRRFTHAQVRNMATYYLNRFEYTGWMKNDYN